MKSAMLALALALACANAFAGRQDPLLEPPTLPIPAQRSASDVANAVRAGIAASGWAIEETTADRWLITRSKGMHVARVFVVSTEGALAVRYLDSLNLGYEVEDGERRIHPTYNAWVQQLVAALGTALQGSLAEPPPAEDEESPDPQGRPVAIVSDGCVLQIGVRTPYYLLNASTEFGRSAARAAAESLKADGITVTKAVTPFICGVINYPLMAPPTAAEFEIDDSDVRPRAVHLPQALDVSTADDAHASAYLRLLDNFIGGYHDTVSGRHATRVTWPRPLNMSPEDRLLLQSALGSPQAWVLRTSAFQISMQQRVGYLIGTGIGGALGGALAGAMGADQPPYGAASGNGPKTRYSNDVGLVDLAEGIIRWHGSARGQPIHRRAISGAVHSPRWFANLTAREKRQKSYRLPSGDRLALDYLAEEELRELRKWLNSRDEDHWELACRHIPFTGITEEALFDRIDQLIRESLGDSPHQRLDRELVPCARALAASGNVKYASTLEKYVGRALPVHDRREREAERQALEERQRVASLLPRFTDWNPAIARLDEHNADVPLAITRARNMLRSPDPGLQEAGRQRAAVLRRINHDFEALLDPHAQGAASNAP